MSKSTIYRSSATMAGAMPRPSIDHQPPGEKTAGDRNAGGRNPEAKPTQNREKRPRQKTHCIHGHPMRHPNLYIDSTGRRSCRECQIQRAIRWKERRGWKPSPSNVKLQPDGTYRCSICQECKPLEECILKKRDGKLLRYRDGTPRVQSQCKACWAESCRRTGKVRREAARLEDRGTRTEGMELVLHYVERWRSKHRLSYLRVARMLGVPETTLASWRKGEGLPGHERIRTMIDLIPEIEHELQRTARA